MIRDCNKDHIRPQYDCGGPICERNIPTQNAPLINVTNKIREVRIIQVDHGYILNVGCKTIALDTPAKIIFALKLYLTNPAKVEDAFLNGKFKFEK